MQITIDPRKIIDRWTSSERPLFKGSLIDASGCKCAQGDVLSLCGVTDDDLRTMSQHQADKDCAAALGISRLHAILLRNINDRDDGCPQDVLKATGLRRIFGPHWRAVLAFGRHIDSLDSDGWAKVAAARAAAGDAAWAAARAAARAAAWDAAWAAARAAAGDAAGAAAGAAARAAARAAAGDAARAAARAAAGDAAWAAARAAAGDAAGAAAGDAAWELVGWSKLAKPFFLAFFFADSAAWVAQHDAVLDPGVIDE